MKEEILQSNQAVFYTTSFTSVTSFTSSSHNALLLECNKRQFTSKYTCNFFLNTLIANVLREIIIDSGKKIHVNILKKTNLYTEKNFNKKQLPGKSQKEKKQISIFTFDECLILCEEFQREFDFRETNANKNQSS